jgi:hypothetical protein
MRDTDRNELLAKTVAMTCKIRETEQIKRVYKLAEYLYVYKSADAPLRELDWLKAQTMQLIANIQDENTATYIYTILKTYFAIGGNVPGDFNNQKESEVKYMTTQQENWIESKLEAYGNELRDKGMEEIATQISEEKLSSDDEAEAIAELEQEIEKQLEDYRAELLKEVEA